MLIKIFKYISLILISYNLFISRALAEKINVVTDISPIYSLVASVMEGVDEPKLIITHGNSPHHHTLKPSEASSLYNADLIFYLEGLSPSFIKALGNTKDNSRKINLSKTKGLTLLPFRTGAFFEDHGDDIKTGPRGGRYRITDKGRKSYDVE